MKNILLGLTLVSMAFPAFANPAYSRSYTPVNFDYVDDSGSPLSEDEALSLLNEGLFVPEEPAPQPEQPVPAPTPQPEPQPQPQPQPEPQPQPQPEQPAPVPRPVPRPLPLRAWVCIAADRHGHRFIGRSFVPGQARRIALMTCMRGGLVHPRPIPFSGCHILRCFRR